MRGGLTAYSVRHSSKNYVIFVTSIRMPKSWEIANWENIGFTPVIQ